MYLVLSTCVRRSLRPVRHPVTGQISRKSGHYNNVVFPRTLFWLKYVATPTNGQVFVGIDPTPPLGVPIAIASYLLNDKRLSPTGFNAHHSGFCACAGDQNSIQLLAKSEVPGSKDMLKRMGFHGIERCAVPDSF